MHHHITLSYESDKLEHFLLSPVTIVANNKSIQVIALWDTGSDITCITNKVVKELNLKSNGEIMHGAWNTLSEEKMYDVTVVFSYDLYIPNISVINNGIMHPEADLLIGTDILHVGDFLVTNSNGKTKFYFRYPSQDNTFLK